jgi:hypothetical protein
MHELHVQVELGIYSVRKCCYFLHVFNALHVTILEMYTDIYSIFMTIMLLSAVDLTVFSIYIYIYIYIYIHTHTHTHITDKI